MKLKFTIITLFIVGVVLLSLGLRTKFEVDKVQEYKSSSLHHKVTPSEFWCLDMLGAFDHHTSTGESAKAASRIQKIGYVTIPLGFWSLVFSIVLTIYAKKRRYKDDTES